MASNKLPLYPVRLFAPLRAIKRHASKLCLLLIILLATQSTRSQTFDEWFHQKKTQIKYLTQQIAHLQAQIILLKKGYDIAKDGWDMIHDMTNGEFSIHKEYFGSLDKISTAIDNDPKKTISQIQYLIEHSK